MQQYTQISSKDIQLNIYKRKFWVSYILKIFIIIPSFCKICGNNTINITDHNTLANPLIGRCTRNSCRKIYYLREQTFLSFFPKTIASTIMYIIKLWILEKKIIMKFIIK